LVTPLLVVLAAVGTLAAVEVALELLIKVLTVEREPTTELTRPATKAVVVVVREAQEQMELQEYLTGRLQL
jgi:hypothetical protein